MGLLKEGFLSPGLSPPCPVLTSSNLELRPKFQSHNSVLSLAIIWHRKCRVSVTNPITDSEIWSAPGQCKGWQHASSRLTGEQTWGSLNLPTSLVKGEEEAQHLSMWWPVSLPWREKLRHPPCFLPLFALQRTRQVKTIGSAFELMKQTRFWWQAASYRALVQLLCPSHVLAVLSYGHSPCCHMIPVLLTRVTILK